MFLKLRTLLLPFFAMVFSFFTNASFAQSTAYADQGLNDPAVMSDQVDYQPGQTAHITGIGWYLDDSVHVEFKETPDYPDYHIYDVAVNPDGSWQIDYLIEQRHLGVTFNVIASGKTTGFIAQTSFTDGSISASPNPACVGDKITITLNTSNLDLSKAITLSRDGTTLTWKTTTPSYTYEISSALAGDHGAVYTYSATTLPTKQNPNGTAEIGTVTLAVNAKVTPTISISSDATNNTICAGTTVIFSSNVSGGGTAPTYQWYRNGSVVTGAAGKGAKYTVKDLANGDQVYCLLTTSATCYTTPTNTATSGTITTTVNPNVTPSVTIAPNGLTVNNQGKATICAGTSVTFTATPTGGGSSPTYQWKINGNNVNGSNASTFATTTLNNNDVVSCAMTSNAPCASPNPVTSTNDVTMIVNPVTNPTVSIAITTGSNPSCIGSSVTFTATPTNGGTAPTYQWKVNNNNVSGQTASTFTTTTLVTGDVVTCQVKSTDGCNKDLTGTSTGITMAVNAALTITSPTKSNTLTVTYGTDAIFTVTTTGGTGVTYKWEEKANNNFQPISNGPGNGATAKATYTITTSTDAGVTTSTLKISKAQVAMTNYQYHCVVTSTGTCASSSTSFDATLQVNPIILTPVITANDKTYDHGTRASLSSTTLQGTILDGEIVTLDTTSTSPAFSANFANANVGPWTVTALNLRPGGAGAANYALSSTTAKATANINKKSITTLTFTASNKRYNGSNAASVGNFAFGADNLDGANLLATGGTATFDDKNVGNGKIVTLQTLSVTGSAVGNYSFAFPYATTTTANITLRPFVIGITADDKIYDGGTAAAVHAYIAAATTSFNGKVAGDNLTVDANSGSFPSKNVGTYDVSANTLFGGADVGNYTLAPDGPDPLLPVPTGAAKTSSNDGSVGRSKTAKITQATLHVTATGINKVYDGTKAATVTLSNDHIGDDDVSVTYTANFRDRDAGQVKPVDVTNIAISGGDAGNYTQNTTTTTTADITKRPLTINVNTGQNKVYGQDDPTFLYALALDGSNNPMTLGTGDAFVGALSRDPGQTVGTSYKILQSGLTIKQTGIVGPDLSTVNYDITYHGATFAITQRTITITADTKSKVYGQADPTLTYGSTPTTHLPSPEVGLAYSDAFGGALGRAIGETVSTYAINNGTLKIMAGTDDVTSNYNITYSNIISNNGTPSSVAKLCITTRPITITVNPNQTKVYGDPDPTFSYSWTPTTHLPSAEAGLAFQDGFDGVLSRDHGTALTEKIGTTYVINQGTLKIVAGTTDVSSNYKITYDNANKFSITAATVCASYNGTLFANSSATGGTVPVNLSLVLTDNGANLSTKDLSTATVTFKIYNDQCTSLLGTVTGTAGNVTTANGVSTITFTGSYTSGTVNATNPSITYVVKWDVGGNYVANPNCNDGRTEVTVSFPQSDYSTGGGYVKLTTYQSSAPTTTHGDVGSKNNFGFDIKWNKSMSTLQGHFNTIIRSGTKVYQVKSNKATYLTVNPKFLNSNTEARATITFGNAVIQDVTAVMNGTSTTPTAIDGNGTVVLDVYDNGEPGSGINVAVPDKVGFLVKDKNGKPWFATNTFSTSTNLADTLPLSGGNIQIRTSTSTTALTTQAVTMNTVIQEVTDAKFGLTAFPNPTASQFSVHLTSSNTTDKITLRVSDAHGRTIDVLTNLYAGQTIKIGDAYRPGVYFVEIMQGNNHKQVKLLKALY